MNAWVCLQHAAVHQAAAAASCSALQAMCVYARLAGLFKVEMSRHACRRSPELGSY